MTDGFRAVYAEHRSVLRRRLKPAERLLDNVRRNLQELRSCFALHPFGKCRSRRDGSRAAPNLETRFRHTPVLESGREPEDIAAGRVRNLHRRGRRRKLADISRISKMIQELIGMHVSPKL